GPPALHAAHDGAGDPARERGDRGPHPRHRAAGPARYRSARGRGGHRLRGVALLVLLVIVVLAVGLGIVELIALPFGGISTGPAIFFGFLLVAVVIGVLVVIGRRRPAPRRA